MCSPAGYGCREWQSPLLYSETNIAGVLRFNRTVLRALLGVPNAVFTQAWWWANDPTSELFISPFCRRVEYRDRCRTVMRMARARPHCALATWPQMKAAEGRRSQAGAACHVTVPTRSPADWQSTPSPARRTTQRAAYPVAVASESSQPRYMHKVWTWTGRSWPKLLSSSRAPRRLAVLRSRPCQVVHPGGSFPSSKNIQSWNCAPQDGPVARPPQSGFAVKRVNSRAVYNRGLRLPLRLDGRNGTREQSQPGWMLQWFVRGAGN